MGCNNIYHIYNIRNTAEGGIINSFTEVDNTFSLSVGGACKSNQTAVTEL